MAQAEIRVGIEGFQRAVQGVLDEFKKTTEHDLEHAVYETAKEVRKRTRAASPVKSGGYKKSWQHRAVNKRIGSYERIVFNGSHGRLTHLLQKGHQIRNQHGGPYGRVSGRPHITPDPETERIFVQKFKALMER